ncbi:MAG: hypothetical protein AAGC88_00465 [Bacteroidota bacterium]
MSVDNSDISNLLKYLLFLAIIGLILYLIPSPPKKANTIRFETSRNPEKVEVKINEAEEFGKPENNEVVLVSDTEPEEIDNKPLQLPIEEEDGHAEELINVGRFNSNETASNSGFESVERNTQLSDIEYFREFSRIYKERKLKGVQPESRTDVVIRYYEKQKDGDKIFELRNLGFYIHQRPSSERFDQYASNAIYYGDQVAKEDIKMVAYTLIRQGVDIKTIEPSQFFSDWKAHSIEIGTDDTIDDAPPLTIGDVRDLNF